MRIPARGRELGLKFDITPLIDIVFQLVIFFLAATYIIHSDASEPVKLPTATQADDRALASPHRWTITITAQRMWLLGNQSINRDLLERKLETAAADPVTAEKLEVRLRADADVPFSEVEPLMRTCGQLGIRKLGFAVLHAADQ